LSFFARALPSRLAGAGLAVALLVLIAGCSGSARAVGTPAVGTSAGVVLTSSTNTTQLQQGTSLTLTATVGVDPNSEGVTWVLSGLGTLTAMTKTSVLYTAPATGVVGTTTPTITATAIHDATETSTATMVVLGTPVIVAPILFPANVNSPYGAGLVVSGGKAPFVWAQGTGTLPPGITLGVTSTTSITSFSGTPTAAGTYTFQVKATDSNTPAIVSTVNVTIVVKAAAACLLEGQYALVYTGFDSNNMTVSAASLNVSATGTITGYHDFSTTTTPVAETLTGTCTTRISNNGLLTLTGTANSPRYDYAVTTALTRGRIQLDNGGDTQSGTGFFQKQDPTAFEQTALAGNFAFGTLGAQTDGTRLGLVGALAIDAGGTVTGHVDANGSSALTDAVLAGVLGAPDTNGRGTLTLTATATGGNQTFHFAYYIVNANRLLLVTTDAAPRMAGYMTRQTGTFDNTSLANPAILSLWGAAKVAAPKSVMTLARLSAANATTGAVVLHLDVASELTASFDENTGATNGTYAVGADGRATFGFGAGTSARHFVVYLDSAANGYVLEQGSAVGNSGILEPQAAGPFTSTVPGFFVSGTQYPEDVAPMVLMPSVSIANGVISASAGTGYFALDTATGRSIGTATITGSGQSLFVMYVVNPNRVVLFRTGALNRSATMDWLDAN
jgi:hypothetical protein